MENYRSGPHSRYDLKCHFVWVTEYRKPVLVGKVGLRLRELVREVCRSNDIEILQGSVFRDHVHVFLSCPPNLSPSRIVQYIKGKSSRKLMMEFKHIQKQSGVDIFGHEDSSSPAAGTSQMKSSWSTGNNKTALSPTTGEITSESQNRERRTSVRSHDLY